MDQVKTISVIMTSHNRADTTMRCLNQLQEQTRSHDNFELHVTLVDDGSTDGTAQRVSTHFGSFVDVIHGDGNLYWSGGMALAHDAAASAHPDAILWLNDDVDLDNDAILRMIRLSNDHEGSIIVGAMCDASRSVTTYSGYKRTGLRPGAIKLVEPLQRAQPVDTLNGNLVLIPRAAYLKLGPIESRFDHAYGDWDYGYRAAQSGVEVVLGPGYFGVCERNGTSGTWRDDSLSRVQRTELLFGRKGYPFRTHVLFMRRHGGLLWPIYFAASYLKSFALIGARR